MPRGFWFWCGVIALRVVADSMAYGVGFPRFFRIESPRISMCERYGPAGRGCRQRRQSRSLFDALFVRL